MNLRSPFSLIEEVRLQSVGRVRELVLTPSQLWMLL